MLLRPRCESVTPYTECKKRGFPVYFQTGVISGQLVDLDVDLVAGKRAERVVASNWWDARVSARWEDAATEWTRRKTGSRSGAFKGRRSYVK
jgi:hypothetical protein